MRKTEPIEAPLLSFPPIQQTIHETWLVDKPSIILTGIILQPLTQVLLHGQRDQFDRILEIG